MLNRNHILHSKFKNIISQPQEKVLLFKIAYIGTKTITDMSQYLTQISQVCLQSKKIITSNALQPQPQRRVSLILFQGLQSFKL